MIVTHKTQDHKCFSNILVLDYSNSKRNLTSCYCYDCHKKIENICNFHFDFLEKKYAAMPLCVSCFDNSIEELRENDYFVYTASENNNALKYLPLMLHMFFRCIKCRILYIYIKQ